MHYFAMGQSVGWGPSFPAFIGVWLVALILWSIVWKGLALWRAAKRGDKVWFLVFLVLNTLGILEIIYLFAVTGAKLSDFSLSNWSKKD